MHGLYTYLSSMKIAIKKSDFSAALSYALSSVQQEHLTLKDKQVEAVELLYQGHDVFLWVPTGYGKSICYQVLPFLFDYKLGRTGCPPCERSVVLVISPLVSLMVDQVNSLQSRGVTAGVLSGNKGVDRKFLACKKEVLEGKFRLLYSSPEAIISSDRWKQLLLAPPLSTSVAALAVDEAYCVYKW